MEQRVSLITLGVDDLARSKAFYERLGWYGQEVEETVFFPAGPLVITLWSREKLAADCGLDVGKSKSFGGIALAHNVRSTQDVDATLASAQSAGATITRRATTTFYGGYAGVFTDPDGHAWEISHNPGFQLSDDGSITLPDFSTGN